MTAATPTRDETVWGLLDIWAATLPGMTDTDFDHEADRVAYEPASPLHTAMRDHIDVERARRQQLQPWHSSWRADPRARPLADRHYNRQKVGAAQFVPPGRCLVLLTEPADAVWVTSWPIAKYVQHAWAGAMVNSLFRREGGPLASDLIVAATAATRAHWPDLPPMGIVSFVDADKTRRKRDPGRCYRRAGWTHVGETAGGLLAFQLLPADFPEPVPARPRYQAVTP